MGMRIGIDARVLYKPILKGIGVYIDNLLINLAEIDQQNEYILYYDTRQTIVPRKPNKNNFIDKGISIKKGDRFYLWEQLRLPIEVIRDRIDIFHSPANTGILCYTCPIIVTIHDVTWYQSLSEKPLDKFYFTKIQSLILKQIKKIITPSAYSKNMIMNFMNINEKKIEIVPMGINESFRVINNEELIERTKRKYLIKGRYIFNVGGESPWKNISRLIKAYYELVNKYKINEQLVITGIRTKSILRFHLQEISKLNLTDRVIILDYVSSEDLVTLYNGAEIFVYPSIMEGFGFPPLESMACGIPVAASNATSIPEIVGDTALLFNGNNTEEIASVIYHLLKNNKLKDELAKKGFQKVKQFKWNLTAQKTLQIYKDHGKNKL